MKGNNGKRRIGLGWLSLLLVVALLTPMFSSFALAEEYEEGPAFEAEYSQDYEEEHQEMDMDLSDIDDSDDESDEDEARESEEEEKEEKDDDETEDKSEEESEDEETADDDDEEGLEETAETFEAEEEIVDTVLTIFDFDRLDESLFEMKSKPDMDDFIDELDDEAWAVLSDGTEELVPIEWECKDEYDFNTKDYGEFKFVAHVTEDCDYAVDAGATLPEVTLFVDYISDIIDLVGGSEKFYSEFKPETVEMAATQLNFPGTVKATLMTYGDEDEGREIELPVDWECANYGDDEKVYTFTAVLNPTPEYPLTEEAQEMPTLTLEIVSDFVVDIKKEKAIILGWNGTSDTLTVPENIAGYPVEEIASNAFAGHEELMDVTLSKSVRKIGAKAFDGCSNLRFVTITDSLTDVARNAFPDNSDMAITLEVNGDKTTLSGQNQFKHDGDTVTVPQGIGSLVVNDDGELTVATNFTVENGNNYNKIHVENGGRLTLEKGYEIHNKSDIIVDGSDGFVNNGAVYGCYTGKAMDGVPNYITNHTEDTANPGFCKICGQAFGHAERKLSVTMKDSARAKLNREYNGKENITGLSADDFELDKTGIDEEDQAKTFKLRFVSAAYDDEKVGQRIVTAKFKLDQPGDCKYSYVVEDFTAQGTISQKNLKSGASIEHIDDQRYTNKALEPEVTVKLDDGRILEKDEDYTVAYSSNKAPGTGKVTVTGRGNYTGKLTGTFDIVQGKVMTLKYIGEEKPSKTYDGSNEIILDYGDFTLDGKPLAGNVDLTGTLDSANAGEGRTVTAVATTDDGDTAECTITGAIIEPCDITETKLTKPADQKETGVEIEPDVKLTLNGKPLVKDRDYALTYKNNVKIGKATVTITGRGNFTGTRKSNFNIVAAGNKKTKTLNVELIGDDDKYNKVYDGTTNSNLKVSDFRLDTSNVDDEDIGHVKLTGINAYYDGKDVGDHQLKILFDVESNSAKYDYKVVFEPVDAEITARQLVVYPLPGQYKIYGTRDPELNGVVKGLLEDDFLPEVELKYDDEDGEGNVGTYLYTLGDYKVGKNYQLVLDGEQEEIDSFGDDDDDDDDDDDEERETFTIRPKNLAAADITVKFDETVYRTRDEKPVEPEITVTYHAYDGDKELEEGTDYKLTFTDNTKRGTGHAIITAVDSEECNYTGYRIEDFRIKKEHSGGSSSSSSSYDDDDDDDDFDDDDDGSSEEEEEQDEPKTGELWVDLDDENQLKVGYILFGQDNRPRGFEYSMDDIEQTEEETAETGEDDTQAAEDALTDAGITQTQQYPLDADGNPILPKRLTITPDPLMDPTTEMPRPLTSDPNREMYEWLQLRLTPEQVNMLKNEHFEELVYQIENTELHVPLERLTYDIDIATLNKDADQAADAEAGEESAGDDGDTDESWEDEETEEADEEDSFEDEEEADMDDGELIAPEMVRVTSYVFTIEQVEAQNLRARESNALDGYTSLLPLYRVSMDAVDGELPAILDDTVVETDSFDSVTEEPKHYPLLEGWTDVEIRVNEGLTLPTEETVYELPAAAQMLIVADDAEMSDEDAIERTQAEYINDEVSGQDYARFAGVKNGLHTIVLEEGWTGDDESGTPEEEEMEAEEEEGEDEEFEDIEEGSEESEPAVEPVAEEEPDALIEDPDPTYAYSRKSNAGDQYWLINTQEKTVEYYRGDTNTYLIGDYTGSLMSGMDVTFRAEPSVNTKIQLKFKQTYKFAMMDDAGASLLMEQDDVATVQSIMGTHRQ